MRVLLVGAGLAGVAALAWWYFSPSSSTPDGSSSSSGTTAGAALRGSRARFPLGGATTTYPEQSGSSSSSTSTSGKPAVVETIIKWLQAPPAKNVVTYVNGAPAAASPSLSAQLGATALGIAAPTAPLAVGRAFTAAGDFVATGQVNPVNPGRDTGTVYANTGDEPAGGFANKVGDWLKGIGAQVSTVTPLAGVFAADSLSVRGKSDKQQAAIFGQATVKTLQVGLGYIPVLGSAVGAVIGILSGTGDGQKVVGAVGGAVEQGYNAQKDILNRGDVGAALDEFQGGSNHAGRKQGFLDGVAARIRDLQTRGGTVTATDAQAFGNAAAMGFQAAQGFTVGQKIAANLSSLVTGNQAGVSGVGSAGRAALTIVEATAATQTQASYTPTPANFQFSTDPGFAQLQRDHIAAAAAPPPPPPPPRNTGGFEADGTNGAGWLLNADGSRGTYTDSYSQLTRR